jgi:hypothetical protein
MLVENAIADGVHFFHLDALCSGVQIEALLRATLKALSKPKPSNSTADSSTPGPMLGFDPARPHESPRPNSANAPFLSTSTEPARILAARKEIPGPIS